MPDLALGGWANPHADAGAQVGHLLDDRVTCGVLPDADRVASQPRRRSERFLGEADAPGPVAAGNVRRLLLPVGESEERWRRSSEFLPVPVEELTREFADRRDRRGDLRAIDPRAHRAAGVRHFYISNLPLGRAAVDAAAHPGRVSRTELSRLNP